MKLFFVRPKKLKFECKTIKNVEKHRKMDCLFYEFCLSYSAYLEYKSFSCKDCKLYIKDEKPIDDEKKCIKLLNEIKKEKK